MADSATNIAAKLAEDVIKVQDATGEERLFMEVSEVLGAASQTLEEAFLTEVRIRLAERKARNFLTERVKKIESDLKAQLDG